MSARRRRVATILSRSSPAIHCPCARSNEGTRARCCRPWEVTRRGPPKFWAWILRPCTDGADGPIRPDRDDELAAPSSGRAREDERASATHANARRTGRRESSIALDRSAIPVATEFTWNVLPRNVSATRTLQYAQWVLQSANRAKSPRSDGFP